MNILKANKTVFYAIFWLVAICFGIVLLAFPKVYDDWWFTLEFYTLGEDEFGHHNLWTGIKESFIFHWKYDTIRLANHVSSLLLLVPRWIPASICAMCFGLGLWLMSKVADVRLGQAAKMGLLCLLVVFPNIWQEELFSQMFAFNYICPIPLLFGSVFIFLKEPRIKLWLTFIIGLLLGMWHESFSASIAVSFGFLLIFKLVKFTKPRLILFIGVCVGLAIILSAPAIWSRSETASILNFDMRLLYLSLIFIFLFLYIFSWFSKLLREVSRAPLQIITLITTCLLCLVAYFTGITRSAFPATLLCCCSIVIYISNIFPEFFNKISRCPKGNLIFSIFCFILLATHLITVCIETFKIRLVANEINEAVLMNLDNRGAIFAKVRYPWQFSPFALGRPDKDLFLPRSYYYMYFQHFYKNKDFMIVPAELKEYTANEGQLLPGGTDCRLWNGHIVSPNLNDTVYKRVAVTYGGRTEDVALQSVIFPTISGREFVYIVPDRSTISFFLGEPKSITLQ